MIPVIVSGGSGTRLWPISRASCPKQFVELLDQSLFAMTLDRLKTFGVPWCITGAGLRVLTEREYRKQSLSTENIYYEPMARNTAAAVAWICKIALDKGLGQQVLGVFPADHVVRHPSAFTEALQLASRWAEKGHVVTLGVKPTKPATGYGYIEVNAKAEEESQTLSIHPALGFREKPQASVAEEYLRSGNYFWNAGIFVFRADLMAELLQKHLPELWKGVMSIAKDGSNLNEVFPRLPSQSIDYGVMEKLESFMCVPGDFGWSDLGSWDELADLNEGTPVTALRSEGNYVHGAKHKVYAMVGVEDLIVVDTSDACLIMKKGQSQDVKKIVEALDSAQVKQVREQVYDFRPWGYFEVLRDARDFKSKIIEVDPGHKISYQSHAKRSEHWIILEGQAEVTIDGQKFVRKPGEAIIIPQGAKHRVFNSGRSTLRFIEVQVGSYFGEDDITRYSDDYGRV
jgi:mannose-1-phosphate guanylyltransferase/mannose-6-phosphate isomerase